MLFHNKLKSVEILLIIFIGILLLSRILLMSTIVLTDNTESRYAEIARLTLTHGLWLMPHTEIGQPFFAKPPLSIWLSALSGKLFGISAFSMRLPAFLAGLLTLWCVWQWDRQLSRSARLFCLFAALTSPLFFISIGAVMTDAVQMACVTAALLCVQRCLTQTHTKYWRIAFWLACGLGMLIKGLATLALIFLPLILFAISGAGYRRLWQKLWSPLGISLGILVCIPWYIAAESAYPGFLQYFFIGEHLMRFIDPNWSGDRFGHPHRYPIGTIWLFWIIAILPWIWIFIRQAYLKLQPASWSHSNSRSQVEREGERVGQTTGLTKRHWIQHGDEPHSETENEVSEEANVSTANVKQSGRNYKVIRMKWNLNQSDETQRLLWCACLAPLLFFTFARSIIVTYPLTAIPPFVILIGYWYTKQPHPLRKPFFVCASVLLTSVMLISIFWLPKKFEAYSARTMIEIFQLHASPEQKLIYTFQPPYSAYFHSKNKIQVMTQTADWLAAFNQPGNLIVLTTQTQIPDTAHFNLLHQDKKFILIQTK